MDQLEEADRLANGDVDVFISEFNRLVRDKVESDPLIVRTCYWQG